MVTNVLGPGFFPLTPHRRINDTYCGRVNQIDIIIIRINCHAGLHATAHSTHTAHAAHTAHATTHSAHAAHNRLLGLNV